MSNLKNIITTEEFFRKKIRENHQVPKDFSLIRIDWLNGEETMRWAHEYAKLYAAEVIKEASELACDSLELFPSEYKKLEQSILKLIEEL